LGFSIEEIVWYHSLRNELYHSGNGMVPEAYVLESARIAALGVFQTLFEADVAPLLDGDMARTPKHTERALFPAQNDEMELLRLFIDFERALQRALASQLGADEGARPVPVLQMWQRYKTFANTPPEWDDVVNQASSIRNHIAHGKADKLSDEEVVDSYLSLIEIIDSLQKQASNA
jgi:hypothetical protein